MAKADQHGVSEREGKAWGKGEFANMPKETKMDMYPKSHEAGPGVLDDTMTGIDASNKKSSGKTRKYLSNQH